MRSIIFGLLISLSVFEASAQSGRSFTLYGMKVPLHDLEEVAEDEIESIHETSLVFKEFYMKKYIQKGMGTLRGVHPKGHGCIRGTMRISKSLNSVDRVGIFKTPGKKYDVIARFSNGSPHLERPDNKADSRGFGLKVLGVSGEPLIKNIPGGSKGTQEFTMNSSDAFFADTPKNYLRFMQIALLETTDFADAAKKFILELAKDLQPALAARVLKAFNKIQNVEATNPLALQYFSISAFQHGAGNQAPIVKYSLAPCRDPWYDPINSKDPDFLSKNLKSHINQSPACFRFLVQHRTDESLSVEDPTRAWDEDIAPFVEIAEVHFPKQELMDEMSCETEVINPWNTLPEHKPVGGINRTRLGSYVFSIDSRKRTNK